MPSFLLGPSNRQQEAIEERIRTLSQFTCALGILAAALYFLRSVLIPFVLSLALKHLLQPVIDMLTVRPLSCLGFTLCKRKIGPFRHEWMRPFVEAFCQLKLPYWLAVCVALLIAFTVLGGLGFIVADSVHVFSERADSYSRHAVQLFEGVIGWMDTLKEGWVFNSTSIYNASKTDKEVMKRLEKLASQVPVTKLIVSVIESLLEMLSNLFLVLLFTIYLLIGSQVRGAGTRGENSRKDRVLAQAEAQILAYIKGKVFVSLLTGALTAVVLASLSVDLWLVFGTLAFWLNFIPNVGSVIAVALPLPVVLLDPSISAGNAVLAIGMPMGIHAFIGNVVEPLLFGHSLELHPVVVLFSLMLWGAVWGVTGMILAVPITAVLRIHLTHIDHPLPQYLAAVLVGKSMSADANSPPTDEVSNDEESAISAAVAHSELDQLAVSMPPPPLDAPLLAADEAAHSTAQQAVEAKRKL